MVIPALDYRLRNNFGGISFETSVEHGLKVPLHCFDDVFVLPRLDLLKIDVEGMELGVLLGAEETIKKFRPVIYMENDHREKSRDLLKFLFNHEYRVWWHTPALYNADNYFQNPENVFGDVVSLNVLAIRSDANVTIGLTEIVDENSFPDLG